MKAKKKKKKIGTIGKKSRLPRGTLLDRPCIHLHGGQREDQTVRYSRRWLVLFQVHMVEGGWMGLRTLLVKVFV